MRNWLLSVCMCLSIGAEAQSISMYFPAFAGKTFEFIIFQGDQSVKAIADTIPGNGKFTLNIPDTYAPYTGMSRWLITNTAEGGGLDMVIPGYGFAVSCLSAQPNSENIIFDGYDAMHELNRLHGLQRNIIERFETMSKAVQLYPSDHYLYSSFVKERDIQQGVYWNFHRELKNNPNYNARLLPIFNLVSGIPPNLTDDYDERARLVNQYISQELDFDHLYTSGHWTGIIQSWVQMHAQMLNNREGFVSNFKSIDSRISDPKKYTDFVGKVTHYLLQYGKDDFIDGIKQTVISSGRITSYEGKTMQVYVKASIGMQAPDLQITEHLGNVEAHNHRNYTIKSSEFAEGSMEYTLLVFYQSGCGPCDALLAQLPGNYKQLKEKGVDIITISADDNMAIFENTKRNLPWLRNYCDLHGKEGINFINYAVQGTPSMYLIGKSGKILKKLASIQDVLALDFQSKL